MKRVSELVGMEIYDENAKLIGKVYDVIIDLQKGEVVRLALEPIHAASREEALRLFKEKTILYKSVKAVERIIIAGNAPAAEEPEQPPAPTKPATSYRYRYQR